MRRAPALAALGVVAAAGVTVAAIELGRPTQVAAKLAPVPLSRLVGQRLMVGFRGHVAPQSLLARVEKGQVGGVILMGGNVSSYARVRRLTASLQRAAARGGSPPLLIAVDQEGGQVKRVPGAPSLAPPGMRTAGVARAQGAATGKLLHSLGITVDLAPVVDVPSGRLSFIEREGRAFSEDPGEVGRLAGAFASGLQARGVAATAKHFPGLGAAETNTDDARAVLRLSDADFDRGLTPFRALIAQDVRIVMMSVASYPSQDSSGRPAASSAAMVARLRALGFRGVILSDSLRTARAGAGALRAGTDIALYVSGARGAYRQMLRAARPLPRADLTASYDRIVSLKRVVASP